MTLEEIAGKWPDELVQAGAALSNELARGVFVFLLEKNSSASFRELAEALRVRQDLLSYHLSKLVSCGLVENVLERREDTRDRSFYLVSTFGMNYADKQLAIVEELWSPTRRMEPQPSLLGLAAIEDTQRGIAAIEGLQTRPVVGRKEQLWVHAYLNTAVGIGELQQSAAPPHDQKSKEPRLQTAA